MQALRLLTERQLLAYREGRVFLYQTHPLSAYQPRCLPSSDLLIMLLCEKHIRKGLSLVIAFFTLSYGQSNMHLFFYKILDP